MNLIFQDKKMDRRTHTPSLAKRNSADSSPPSKMMVRQPSKGSTEDGSLYDYDVFVIGGGIVGLTFAQEASCLGAKVALAEGAPDSKEAPRKPKVINDRSYGPKLLHCAAQCGASMPSQGAAGWNLPETVRHNWTRLQHNMERHASAVNLAWQTKMLKLGVHCYDLFASFAGPHQVMVPLHLLIYL